MAIKANTTKESVPNSAKGASPVPPHDKKGASKATLEAVTPLEPTPVTATKSDTEVTELASKQVSDSLKSAQQTIDEQDVPQTQPVASNVQKWQEIRLILEKLKEDTLREIRKSVKNGTEAVAAIEPGGDIYDQASSERDRELGLLLGDREREKIHSIDEALLRIDEGDYGICEECDEDIPHGRLKAMPFTRHCVKCKSELEKLQAQTKRVEEERAYREIPLGAEEDET